MNKVSVSLTMIMVLGGVAGFSRASAYDADFVSQSVPSTMEAGKTYAVSITMKNPNLSGFGQLPPCGGLFTWSGSCGFGLCPTNSVWGECRNLSSGEVINTNQTKTFSFNVVAPSSQGIYNFQWQMNGIYGLFGDKTLNVAVSVNAACVAKTCAGLGTSCGSVSDGCGATIDCGACASGYSCVNGACAAQCANECSTAGVKRCVGGGYQSCGNYDGDSCLEWSQTTACSGEQTCSAGNCLAASLRHCSGNGYQFCKNYENDACVEWSAAIACPSGQTCANGVCFLCNPGTISGCKVCALSAMSWTDDNSKCSSGQICSGGVCVANGANSQNIGANNNLPSVDITANGRQKNIIVGAGEPVILDWQSTNADVCRAAGSWSGSQATGGSMRATVASSKEYIISCSNAFGSASDSVLVEVVSPTDNGGLDNANNASGATPSGTMTRAQIIEKINQIKELIAALTRQLQSLGAAPAAASCGQINKDLFYGMKGDAQVKCLQEFLKARGFAVVATGDFGGITKSAVIQFQEKYANEILVPYGLTRGSGYVGQTTRDQINRIVAGEQF